MKISYDKTGYSTVEQRVNSWKQIDLPAVFYYCKNNLSISSVKGANGAIYPLTDLKETKTDGVIFADIDNITKETAELIFNNFENLIKLFPSLYGIQYSSSYYLNNKKAGLHIYIKSGILGKDEYNYAAQISLAIIARVIYKLLNIDLRISQIDNEKILDPHNTSIYQRFFLFHTDYKINKDAYTLFEEVELSKDQLDKLKEEYYNIIITRDVENLTEVKLEGISMTNNIIGKICIDRNFSIDKYSGNDIRWRISRIAQALFGVKEGKEFCDKYFYYDNGKSIFTKQNSIEGNSFIIKNWLIKNGYLKEDKENIIRRGEWINKYTDDILKFIKENRRVEIIGPTGTGKTSFINGYKNDGEIFFNEFSLAKELNAIVIVPFNVTNKLYNNLIEVSTDNRVKEIKEDESYVMVWDQALIHWDQIKNRTLIIDEAHCLFLDRSYRDTAVKLMNKIKEDDCKIVLFTATPSGETEELGCKLLKFTNERDIVNIGFNKVNTVDLAELNMIKKCLKENLFDRIVLFDDLNAKKIWEKLYVEGEFINDIAYIRADTKNSEDFILLRENELLNKRLTICTCIAFNGLNFKNENENILVITSYSNGKTTAEEIIQEAGRVRKSNVNVVVYYDDKFNESNLDNRIEKAEIYRDAVVELGIPDTVLSYDRRLLNQDIVEALRRIEDYIRKESVLDNIVKKLNDCGYFNIKSVDNSNKENQNGNKLSLALKAKQSKEFIEDLMNDKIEKYTEGSYKDRWNKRIENIISNESYTGVDINTFKEFINKKNKKTLIETVINNIEKYIKISLIDSEGWKKYVNTVEILKERLKLDSDKRDLANSFKLNCKIRKQWEGIIKSNNDIVVDLSGFFGDIFEEMEEDYKSEKKSKSDAGKKGTKKLQDTKTNKIFNSREEAAKYFDVNPLTITRWIKSNRMIEIK